MNAVERLFLRSRGRRGGRFSYLLMKMLGVEIPRSVVVTGRLVLPHGAVGLVVHPRTQIGDNAYLYQGVTIGRSDSYRIGGDHVTGRVIIGRDVILSAGSKVLFKFDQELVVADGTILGANAVLTSSTGRNEIWAGVPATRIGQREDV